MDSVNAINDLSASSVILEACKTLLPELERRASRLRKSNHHNALHDLHIMECAVSVIDDIIIEMNDQAQAR